MKTILVFDTETTGLPSKTKPLGHPDQPDIIQLAAKLITWPTKYTLHTISVLVQNTAEMHPKAQEAHGISQQIINKFSIAPGEAWNLFGELLAKSDFVVGHNVDYDINMLAILTAKHEFFFPKELLARAFCTMKHAKPIIKIPPTDKMKRAGFNQYKPPSLSECYQHFFNKPLIGAHDALVDVDACADVFFHLVQNHEISSELINLQRTEYKL